MTLLLGGIGVLGIVLLVVLLPVAVLWREVEVGPAHGRIFSGRPVHVERAGGWRSSRTRIRDVAAEIEREETRWQQA